MEDFHPVPVRDKFSAAAAAVCVAADPVRQATTMAVVDTYTGGVYGGSQSNTAADDSNWLQPQKSQPQQQQRPAPKTQRDRIRGSVAVSRKAQGERTATSIPTKFETVLDYEKERDGFLTRTLRFVNQGIAKNSYGQGPGFYHHELPLLFQKESISKKGYGNGFVSNGARFDYSDGVVSGSSPGPGPGTYSMATTDMAAPAAAFGGIRSSMFAPPVSRVGPPFEPMHSSSDPGPGPGSYKLAASKSYAKDARGGKSAFRCGIKRFEEYVFSNTFLLRLSPYHHILFSSAKPMTDFLCLHYISICACTDSYGILRTHLIALSMWIVTRIRICICSHTFQSKPISIDSGGAQSGAWAVRGATHIQAERFRATARVLSVQDGSIEPIE